jgi:GPH family glycoside/pentoside/hexuronide:cation symporter
LVEGGDSMTDGKRLSLGTKLGFGICDVGGNLFVTVLGFYLLNFITDDLLLGADLAGTALLVGKA